MAWAALFLLAGCKKVEVELPEQQVYPMVVEAVMSNLAPLEVTLSWAVPFSHAEPFPEVEGALATFTEDGGQPMELTQWETGRFSGGAATVPGHAYFIQIQTPNGNIEASATAPAGLITIDSLTAQRLDNSTVKLTGHLRLPPFRPVYTRTRVWVDGLPHEDFFIEKTLDQQDVFTLEVEVFYTLPGSTATLELTTLPKPAFEFYSAVGGNALNNNFNPANSKNPPTNLSGTGAIGFFSVALTDTSSVVIP